MSRRTVVQILRNPEGGIRKHVVDILDGLSDKDVRQVLVTDYSKKDKDLDFLKEKGIIIIDVTISNKPGLLDIVTCVKIYRHLRQYSPDVIHGHGAKGGLYARVLAFLLRSKAIYTPHGGSVHRMYGRLSTIIYNTIENILSFFTDVFLFESNYTKNAFLQSTGRLGQNHFVNYNGVEFTKLLSTSIYQSGEVVRMASFGLLRHLKGFDIMIEACKILKERNIPFSYHIYGDGFGDYKNELNSKILQLNLLDEVRIMPYSVDVYSTMLKYDFIIQPSRFESFGYVPVEAMALRIPVISSQNGGLKEVVIDGCGFPCSSNSAKEYAQIIEGLYRNANKLQQNVDKAYSRAINLFNKDTMIKNIYNHYIND